jgi:hypothetical protein
VVIGSDLFKATPAIVLFDNSTIFYSPVSIYLSSEFFTRTI